MARKTPVVPLPLGARIRDGLDHFATTTPARFAILVFTGLIGLVTLLLGLPISNAKGEFTPLVDALFTAVSTICVTGLTTVDMASHWSSFGHAVIFIGVQVGAVGVLTLASIMGLVVSRKIGLRARLLAASDSNPLRVHHGPISESQAVRLGEIGGLLVTVAASLIVIEVGIAILLLPTLLAHGYAIGEAIWQSFYYSVMAFTNTGFTINDAGIVEFAEDYWFLSMLMVAVFLGSIGFPVIFAIARALKKRSWRLSLHVKLTLVFSVGLFLFGGLAFTLLEWGNAATYGTEDPGAVVFDSFFLSMMTRSGGFSTFDVGELHGSSLLVGDMLMFVGGGSASTAGGIKVTTLAVLFLAAYAEARGHEDMEAFGRRIPNDVLRVGVSVLLLSATTIAVSCIAILHISRAPLDDVLFDVISAFATSGLSTGLTMDLPDAGQYILAATMWMGRVGTVTLAVAVAASSRRQLFRRAEERPIVG